MDKVSGSVNGTGLGQRVGEGMDMQAATRLGVDAQVQLRTSSGCELGLGAEAVKTEEQASGGLGEDT